MGRTKPLVPWTSPRGTQPLVVAAYDAVEPVCEDMVVVLGHDAAAVAAALVGRPFHPVHADPDAPMFESVRAGLTAAAQIDPQATVLLQPGDHPEVAEATLHALIAAARRHPGCALIPEYEGRGGHPVVIPPAVARHVVQAECPAGLRQFWIDHPGLCVRLAVDDASVVRDVDTPDQLDG